MQTQGAVLSFTTQRAMPRFPLPTLMCAGYSVRLKLISSVWSGWQSILVEKNLVRNGVFPILFPYTQIPSD